MRFLGYFPLGPSQHGDEGLHVHHAVKLYSDHGKTSGGMQHPFWPGMGENVRLSIACLSQSARAL